MTAARVWVKETVADRPYVKMQGHIHLARSFRVLSASLAARHVVVAEVPGLSVDLYLRE